MAPVTDSDTFPSSDTSPETTGTRRPLTFFRGSTHDTDAERLAALTREIKRWKAYAERYPAGGAMGRTGLREWAERLVGLGDGAQRSVGGEVAV